MDKTHYYAHTKEGSQEKQLLVQHLEKSAVLAEKYAVHPFQELAGIAGRFHDIGKYQSSFQKRLLGQGSLKVEHAGCGAKEITQVCTEPAEFPQALLLAYCICGHHSGLPDGGSFADSADMSTLQGRLRREFEDFSIYQNEVSMPVLSGEPFNGHFASFGSDNHGVMQEYIYLTRYIFSCLTDADFIDTESFCNSPDLRGVAEGDFPKVLERLQKKFANFQPVTSLQKKRSVLQKQAETTLDCRYHIFVLNMPTGSGKTLCSLKMALKTAIETNQKRIIYVIPYNSIVDQTVAVFEDALGDAVPILQHHSNYSYDTAGEDSIENIKLMKATENWDAPLIVTTSVQFFESLHNHKGSRLRKLHNMADSVIILDEAHLLPLDYFQACINSLSFLTETLGSKVFLMSATMPDYSQLIQKLSYKPVAIQELVEDKSDFDDFYKCRYSYLGKTNLETLAEQAKEQENCLIIVNKRRTARELFTMLKGTDQTVYHLSTYMTPYDRMQIIGQIRRDLEEERKICVVSTSLIEAGVDLDFFAVFRELTGLDSILQAGGRCNREGSRPEGQVQVFSLDSRVRGDLAIRSNITEGLFKRFDNVNSPECIGQYYDILLRSDLERLTEKTICALRLESIPFASYGQDFKLIDSNTLGVVIERNEESRKLIESLKYGGSKMAQRKLQRYSATVYEHEFRELFALGVLNDYGTGCFCLTNLDYYDKQMGLRLSADDSYYIC